MSLCDEDKGDPQNNPQTTGPTAALLLRLLPMLNSTEVGGQGVQRVGARGVMHGDLSPGVQDWCAT